MKADILHEVKQQMGAYVSSEQAQARLSLTTPLSPL